MERRKGEITAYLSLTFLLLLSFVGAMIESASIQLAKNYQRADMNRAVECLFAEYQKELLDEYDIFALDATYETGSYAEENLFERLQYYHSGNMQEEMRGIQFLTDQGCQAFYQQVAAYMEHKYGLAGVKSLIGKTDVWKKQEEDAEKYAMREKQEENELESLLSQNQVELPQEDNPIAHTDMLKAASFLTLVLPKEKNVSTKEILLSETLSLRERNTGYGEFSNIQEDHTGSLSKLLYGEYVMEHFGSAVDESQGRSLEYEVEYILEGKASDKENLEAVTKRVFLFRFVPNYTFLQSNVAMKAEAEALALTLCSVLAIPAVTEAATQVILLSWAYGESIIDIRTLLKGNRVPITKSKETWQLSLSMLMQLGTEEDKNSGADAAEGLLYEEYLKILLFLKNQNEVGMRTLDLIEQNLRYKHGLTWFCADKCVSRIELLTTCKLRRGITYRFPTYYGYN